MNSEELLMQVARRIKESDDPQMDGYSSDLERSIYEKNAFAAICIVLEAAKGIAAERAQGDRTEEYASACHDIVYELHNLMPPGAGEAS